MRGRRPKPTALKLRDGNPGGRKVDGGPHRPEAGARRHDHRSRAPNEGEARTMSLTYRNRDEERDDRHQQERLLIALDAAPSQLRRDESGWWAIAGRAGAIHTWGDGRTWLAYVVCRSIRHWTMTKRRLAFMTVTQDGDDEGCLRLFRLPTPEEAASIRVALLLRKRRTLTEESRARLIAAGVNGRFAACTTAPALGSAPEAAPAHGWTRSAPIMPINAADIAVPELDDA